MIVTASTIGKIDGFLKKVQKEYDTLVKESAVVDDINPPEPSITKSIERERKPYSAQVRGGKQYEAEEIRPRENSKPRTDSILYDLAPPLIALAL